MRAADRISYWRTLVANGKWPIAEQGRPPSVRSKKGGPQDRQDPVLETVYSGRSRSARARAHAHWSDFVDVNALAPVDSLAIVLDRSAE
jgi:hypothetical protein